MIECDEGEERWDSGDWVNDARWSRRVDLAGLGLTLLVLAISLGYFLGHAAARLWLKAMP